MSSLEDRFRFCPNCGAEAVIGFSFCGACGKSLLKRPTPSNAITSGSSTTSALEQHSKEWRKYHESRKQLQKGEGDLAVLRKDPFGKRRFDCFCLLMLLVSWVIFHHMIGRTGTSLICG